MGPEAGGKSQHWYDFVHSKRWLLKNAAWGGAHVKTKPGVGYFVAQSLEVKDAGGPA
jgi:hypothetical protein